MRENLTDLHMKANELNYHRELALSELLGTPKGIHPAGTLSTEHNANTSLRFFIYSIEASASYATPSSIRSQLARIIWAHRIKGKKGSTFLDLQRQSSAISKHGITSGT